MTWKMYDKLFFQGPTGLGDYFVINGIINHIADKCEQLHLPCTSVHMETLSCLYGEHGNIIPVSFVSDPTTYEKEDEYCKSRNMSKILRCPTWWTTDNAGVGSSPAWDQQMYSFFELPFSMRYSNFRLPKNIPNKEEVYKKANPNNEPFILVHTGWSSNTGGVKLPIEQIRSFNNLPNYKVIDLTTPLCGNLLSYITLIENAEEIHCVGSAFYCFVDSICMNIKAKLFYHDVRRATVMNVTNPWNNFRWIVVPYKERLA